MNGNFRDFQAYAILVVPFMIVCNGRRARAKSIAGLALLGAVLEGLQHWIPTHRCDWQDVAWGWTGLAAAWFLTEIAYLVAWEIRCEFKHGEPVGTARTSRARQVASK